MFSSLSIFSSLLSFTAPCSRQRIIMRLLNARHITGHDHKFHRTIFLSSVSNKQHTQHNSTYWARGRVHPVYHRNQQIKDRQITLMTNLRFPISSDMHVFACLWVMIFCRKIKQPWGNRANHWATVLPLLLYCLFLLRMYTTLYKHLFIYWITTVAANPLISPMLISLILPDIRRSKRD